MKCAGLPAIGSMKICFYALRDFDELPMARRFEKKYGIEFVWTGDYPNDGNIALAQGCDAISFTPCLVKEEWMQAWSDMGVKTICNRSIGYDHVPLKKAKELGMHVCISPYPTECVADFAIMLILMCIRNMNQTMIRARAQDFTLKNKMGRNLDQLTVGVIGTGHIGRTLIRHIAGFGCRLLCYDEYPNEEAAKLAEYVSFETLLQESDVISLHVPSNPSTYHMLNREAFDKMRDGVVIVNTARGNVIDSKALIDAINSGKVSSAGLDLLENEHDLYYCFRSGENLHNDELNMLRSFPNVIVSPHVAFYVESTVANMVEKSFTSAICEAKGEKNPVEIEL